MMLQLITVFCLSRLQKKTVESRPVIVGFETVCVANLRFLQLLYFHPSAAPPEIMSAHVLSNRSR